MVVGHRGVPRLHQENTLAGFRRAAALGIPAIELDVVLSADGVPVVFHDADVDRLTDGRGAVADLTWDQLARLRIKTELAYGAVGGGAPVVMRYARPEPIARLDEVLAELAGRVAINVEVKLGLPRWWRTEVAARTAEVIAAARATDAVIVTSFDPRKLLALKRAHDNIAYGFCFDDTMLNFARPLLDRLSPFHDGASLPERGIRANAHRALNRILETNFVSRVLGTKLVGAEHTLVGRDTVRRLHSHNTAIGTHTIFPMGSTTTKLLSPAAYTEAEVERLVDIGVDWIETDDPERLQKLIG